MSERIGVIGAGAWGTALAKVLAEQGHEVELWCNEAEVAAGVNERHVNERFLPGVELPAGLKASTDALAVTGGKSVVLLAAPSPYLMGVTRRILQAPNLMEGESLVVVVTKGFVPSPRGPRFIVESLEDHLPGFYRGSVVYLSGPSHAEEVSRGKITGLVAASQSGRNAIRVRELFKGSRVLVFPSLDVVGVQVCAAAKNVVAIAFGMLDAMAAGNSTGGAAGCAEGGAAAGVAAGEGPFGSTAFGDNTESLLLAAGLNEIQTLGRALGASHPETFSSIAGVGDLDVTCRSVHGRNRRFGREIVTKNLLAPFSGIEDLAARIGEIGYLPEGLVAVRHVKEIAAAKGIDLPIMGGVYDILDKKVTPREFLESYLGALGAAG